MTFLRSHGHWVVAVAVCATGLLSLNDMLMYTPDSARYVAWGNSLAQGNGFQDYTTPQPTRYVVHAPLYPLLLAPSQFISPESIPAAKVTSLLFGVLALLLFHWWVRAETGPWTALGATVVLAVNPLYLIYSNQVLSEAPFALCVILFFILGRRLMENARSQPATEAGFIAVIVAGIFLREVGLTLMLGASFLFLLRREYQRGFMILAVGVLFYLLWFLRNEVAVAGLEQPAMRNTRLFFTHLYTPAQTSLVTELWERLWSNVDVYRSFIAKLVFFPDYVRRAHSVIDVNNPAVAAVIAMMPYLQWPLILTTVVLVPYGLFRMWQQGKGFDLTVAFVVFYFGPILLYPINDIRFLFPLVLIMLFAGAWGAHDLVSRLRQWGWSPRKVAFVVIPVLAVLIGPNTVWGIDFVSNNIAYARAPGELIARLTSQPFYPEQFTKPLHLASRWTASRTDTSEVIVSRWKEVALYAGRKVLDLDPQTTPDSYDRHLRDNRVRYIIGTKSRVGLSEYESLFAQSKMFDFAMVHSVGNVEVFVATPRPVKKPPAIPERLETPQDTLRREFWLGMQALETGRPADAETLFQRAAVRVGSYGLLIYHVGVAKALAGNLDEAVKFFESFRSVAQAGTYIQLAWYHQEIIARLRGAEAVASPFERAERLLNVGANYRELGFRHHSLAVLQRSMDQVPDFFPAIIFSTIYRLQTGDTVRAKELLARAKRLEPENALVRGMRVVLANADSMRRLHSVAGRAQFLLNTAAIYEELGLREEGIDALLGVLSMVPDHAEALRRLVLTYELKRRFAPARHYAEAYLRLRPHDTMMQRKLEEIMVYWE